MAEGKIAAVKERQDDPIALLSASSHNKCRSFAMDEMLRTPPLSETAPLKELDDWDDFVATRYQPGKSEEQFRNYRADANPTVTEFYRQNHAHQTLDFVLKKKEEYCGLKRGKKSIWEMAEYLNTLVDESDPDTDLSQIEHLLQTSEAIRKDGHPRWFRSEEHT